MMFLPQSSPPSAAQFTPTPLPTGVALMDFSYTIVYIILLLHFFQGVGGAIFRFSNNSSQDIWPAVLGEPRVFRTTGFELRGGISVALQVPNGWKGRLWGRTGCTFNANGNGSCDTGDCAGRLDCTTRNTSPATLAEFALGGTEDFYDVSLVDGYNLPLLVLPLNESAQCRSPGCVGTGNLDKVCPRTNGSRRIGGCDATRHTFCCRVANYSQVIKKVCSNVIIHPTDNNVFSCPHGSDYAIIFCGSSALNWTRQGIYRPPTNSTPQTGNGTSPAQSPVNSPKIFTDSPRIRNGKKPAKVIIIGVVLGIVCVLIVSIIILCFLKRRRWKSFPSKESKQQIENFLLQHGSVAPKRYKFSEIRKITKSFNDKLGQGGYGSVYKGTLLDGSMVAVKVLTETDDSSNGEEFMNEVASISKTSHVNIVILLGFCYDGNKRALVYEFMPNKSLDKFLKNDGSDNNAGCLSLDLEKLYKIAVGIAKGLEYLHKGCNTRIVHFDIKPQNILLDEDFCPKISDFGLAKLCKKKQSVLSVLGTRGTIGYIAPEVFSRNFGAVSHKSDVYSYGMMVLEMAGAEEIGTVESSENNFPDKIYEHIMHAFTRRVNDLMIEDGEETRIKMYLVGFWCIQTNPRDRPSISRVVEMLEGSVESIEIPPKPVLFAPTSPVQNIPSSLSATHKALLKDVNTLHV